uniref:Uncharacterized protein n=1 Tax=Anguilla anguilla TaxID=7936 RepID=A0A0E9T6S4_ANGAN
MTRTSTTVRSVLQSLAMARSKQERISRGMPAE